jgi:hypothetical protein
MNGRQLARAHRALRIRQSLRQSDVADEAGVGRWKIVDLEAARVDDLKFGEVERCFAVLGANVYVAANWHGAALDRLFDERHARLVGLVVQLLRRRGWRVEIEVSFSERGDRGSIDVFAWHPVRFALAVFEIKSELGGMDPLLRPLDVKVRLAPTIANRFGWRPARSVSRIVVCPEDRTVRRQVAQHQGLLSQALPARGHDVRRWLREPDRAIGGLWFLSDVRRGDAKRNPSAIRRVRQPKPRSDEARVGPQGGSEAA